MDFKNMGSKKVMIVTDSTVARLPAMQQCTQALDAEGIPYTIYQKTRVEPKDTSYVCLAFEISHPQSTDIP